ncbi:MAG: hypothetical protein HON90_09585 [Halobacteriovoraceae bacterium]|jgi:hypothetical protein|nr:hypothetical protein [Halobacteriovoraceae bacterium]
MNKGTTHSPIHLLGNPAENYYILGKRDKNSYSELYHQISMLCGRSTNFAKIIKTTTEISQIFTHKKKHPNIKLIEAYAQGLETHTSNVLFNLLLPEVVASFNKWTPDLLSLIPGCSSLFMRNNQTQDIVHTRILDYAMSGPFEKYERSIITEFPNQYKTLSYSSSGMPLPAISTMNEKGLSLALHYKHGQYFDLEGESIFFIATEIISKCANIREAIKYIKTQKSLSYWGLYLCDKNGEVASIDIKGSEIIQEKFDLRDHQYLYFNNRPLLRKKGHTGIQPYGNENQCRMRKKFIQEKIKKTTLSDKHFMLDTVKLVATPEKHKENESARNWVSPTITPSSIQLCSFNNSKLESLFIPGSGIKYFTGEYIHHKNIFNKVETKHITKKNIPKNNLIAGQNRLAKYQTFIDLGKIPDAYHEIQMAIELLNPFAEKHIAKFFYLVTQYIYEHDKRDLTYLFHDFERLAGKLPHYLEDHRQLFLLRLSKLIGHKISNNSSQIKNTFLKSLYSREYKLSPLALKGLRQLIFTRIEILDILYMY